MKPFIFLATIVAMIAVAAADSENKVLLHIKPISIEEYRSILETGDAEESQRAEGNILSNALAGLSTFTAGLSMSRYINSLFGNNRDTKTVGGYPLCTINAKPSGRQLEGDSYLNIDELTSSLNNRGEHGGGPPVINCVLVVDDDKRPYTTTTRRPNTTPTPFPTGPTFQPTPTTTTRPPTSPTEPQYQAPWYPGGYPSHYYPPYGYPPPPYYYYPYPKPEEDEAEEEEDHHHETTPQSIHSLLLNKLGEFGTTRPPHSRPRPSSRRRRPSRTEYKSAQAPQQYDFEAYEAHQRYMEGRKNRRNGSVRL